MPRRTNEFQKLVYLIKEQLSAQGAVAESKMLTDRITGDEVEVDICIHGSIGGEQVTISVECTDIKRRADKNWVNQMKAKHERLSTNVLVLASRSGFSKGARKVAQAYGINTVSLEEVDAPDLPRLFRAINNLWAKSVSVTAERVVCHVVKEESLEKESVYASPNMLVYSIDREQYCQISNIVEFILKSPYAREYMTKHGAEDNKWFEVELNVAGALPNVPLLIQKTSPPSFWRIESIRIVGPCEIKISKFELSKGQLGDVTVAWGKTELFGQSTMFIVTRDKDGVERNSLAPMSLKDGLASMHLSRSTS